MPTKLVTIEKIAQTFDFCLFCILAESPFSAVQLLWINLIMDTFAAVAFATEPPNDSILTEPLQIDRIVTSVMWRNIIGQAVY